MFQRILACAERSMLRDQILFSFRSLEIGVRMSRRGGRRGTGTGRCPRPRERWAAHLGPPPATPPTAPRSAPAPPPLSDCVFPTDTKHAGTRGREVRPPRLLHGVICCRLPAAPTHRRKAPHLALCEGARSQISGKLGNWRDPEVNRCHLERCRRRSYRFGSGHGLEGRAAGCAPARRSCCHPASWAHRGLGKALPGSAHTKSA